MKGRTVWRDFWRGEAGFGLVEVMVTAVLVVLVATATVSSIAASQRSSTRTLARGITANLADQDQERMRSMRSADLIDFQQTQQVIQGNSTYQVDSESHLVQGPNGGKIGCTSTGQASQFLQLTTVVTPVAPTKGDPQTIVSLDSLPITQYSPTSGTLVVRLVRADGVAPTAGIPVTLTGPDSRTATTNSEGCAIFQFLTPGAYTAIINTNGYVEETLSQYREMSVTVNPAQISSTPIQRYDQAGSITPIRFNGLPTGSASGITISNGGIPNPSTRTYATAATTTAGGLFPFVASPYKVWSGRCAPNNPEVWEPNFYTDNAAATPYPYGPVTVPGSAGTVAANVREPNLRVNVSVRGSNQATFDVNSARLYVRQIDVGCNNAQQFYGDGTTTPAGYSVAGVPSASFGTGTNGATAQTVALTQYNRGFPYGRYWVCAQVTKTADRGGSSPITANGTYSVVGSPVSNTTFAGQTTTTPLALTIDATTNTNRVDCTTNAGTRWNTNGPTALAVPTPTP